jgi:hypothetical protein
LGLFLKENSNVLHAPCEPGYTKFFWVQHKIIKVPSTPVFFYYFFYTLITHRILTCLLAYLLVTAAQKPVTRNLWLLNLFSLFLFLLLYSSSPLLSFSLASFPSFFRPTSIRYIAIAHGAFLLLGAFVAWRPEFRISPAVYGCSRSILRENIL